MPFASDSIDAIFLPHTLELVEDPYAVLREAERVLCAEGCLMICGFNPFSGWGARRAFAQYFRPPGISAADAAHALRAPAARLDGAARTSRSTSVYGYLGLIPMTRRLRKAPDGSLQRVRYRPRAALTAGGYLLKARKRVQTLTLVRPRSAGRGSACWCRRPSRTTKVGP